MGKRRGAKLTVSGGSYGTSSPRAQVGKEFPGEMTSRPSRRPVSAQAAASSPYDYDKDATSRPRRPPTRASTASVAGPSRPPVMRRPFDSRGGSPRHVAGRRASGAQIISIAPKRSGESLDAWLEDTALVSQAAA